MPLNSIQPVAPDVKFGKQEIVMNSLTRLAKELGPGAKLPTARELARTLGITRVTLARCLERLKLQGVLRCRQGSGIYVSDHLFEKCIALVFTRNIFQQGMSPFYSMLLEHCKKRAASKLEHFSLHMATPELCRSSASGMAPRDLEDALAQKKLDGILMAQVRGQDQEEWLRQQGVPVVALTGTPTGPGCVRINTRSLIDLCVESLYAQGCRTMGLMGIIAEHQQIFHDAVKKRGIQVEKRWMCYPDLEINQFRPPSEKHEALGRKGIDDLLTRSGGKAGLPDGLIITDDVFARGACSRLESLGIHPGADIKIATHANKGSDALLQWKGQLTLAEIDPQEIVEAMFSLLERLMGCECGTNTDTTIEVQAHLVEIPHGPLPG